jgi:hypothetical protein
MATSKRSTTVHPMSSREGSGVSRRETLRMQHYPVQARAQVGLSATAAPTDLVWSPVLAGAVFWREPVGSCR